MHCILIDLWGELYVSSALHRRSMRPVFESVFHHKRVRTEISSIQFGKKKDCHSSISNRYPVCANYGACQINLVTSPYYKCYCQTGYYGTNCNSTSPTAGNLKSDARRTRNAIMTLRILTHLFAIIFLTDQIGCWGKMTQLGQQTVILSHEILASFIFIFRVFGE